ncbi:hypothetical protein ACJZ2D_000500 [Fusarium nematophilum]
MNPPGCDSLLPACANCAKSDSECTFRDDALQEDIPRAYVQTLNERIEHLRSQLALRGLESPSHNLALPTGEASQVFHILVPARPGSDLHLDNSVPSRFARVAFEALPLPKNPPDIEDNFPEHDGLSSPALSYTDRSQLSPAVMRFLLVRYERCIRPQYDVAVPELLSLDGTGFKKLPDSPKFKILMACAIAAAHETYKSPNWKPLAQVCRDWADELITPIITAGDSDTLTAILLLLIYELADPSRGITWELLDLAARTCLQLGWHQAPLTSNAGGDDGQNADEVNACGPDEVRHMSVLKEIEGSLQTIFSRPSMLCGIKLPTSSENETIYDLYTQLSDQIYDKGRVYETQSCPFVGEIAALMDILDTLQTPHPVAKETWLSLLPVCFKHKQCISCFQESDEEDARGMNTLRRKVIRAATELISSVHRRATSQHDFIPPIIASSNALISGCSIAVGISKKWTLPQSHGNDLIKCTEILAMFAPHWKAGNDYLSVWRSITNLLDQR